MHRRKFRSQASDNMDICKNRGGKSQTRDEKRKEDQRRERIRRKKMQVGKKMQKGRKVAKHGAFPSFWRLATAAGAEPSGQIRDEQVHAVVV